MSQRIKLRVTFALAFGVLIVLAGWAITELIGFSSDFTVTTALIIVVGAGIWAFVVNDLDVDSPRGYALNMLQYRPLILSFGLFVALIILWGVARASMEWSVEPNIVDYGPCGRFTYGSCGEQDLNSEKRYEAAALVDKIASGVFLIAPLGLAIRKIREIFR